MLKMFKCRSNSGPNLFPKQLGAVGVLAVLTVGQWSQPATTEPSAFSKLLYLIGQRWCHLQKHKVKLLFSVYNCILAERCSIFRAKTAQMAPKTLSRHHSKRCWFGCGHKILDFLGWGTNHFWNWHQNRKLQAEVHLLGVVLKKDSLTYDAKHWLPFDQHISKTENAISWLICDSVEHP